MYCSEILISVSWKDHLYFYIQHKKMPNLIKPKMFITKKKNVWGFSKQYNLDFLKAYCDILYKQ